MNIIPATILVGAILLLIMPWIDPERRTSSYVVSLAIYLAGIALFLLCRQFFLF
jgi:hypothetical protein